MSELTYEQLTLRIRPGRYAVGCWQTADGECRCPMGSVIGYSPTKRGGYLSDPYTAVAEDLEVDPQWVEGFVAGWDDQPRPHDRSDVWKAGHRVGEQMRTDPKYVQVEYEYREE